MKLLCVLMVLVLGAVLPAVAAADPSAADRATARALGLEGEAALARHDYARAADRYARAEALFHAPTLLLGLARAQVQIGKLVDAQENYRRIVTEGLPPNAPPIFLEAVASAEKELSGVTPRIAWLTIVVTGVATPAVRLDDADLPAAALGVRRAVDPGTHTVLARGDGGLVKKASVTLTDGKTETVTLDLTPAVAPATPAAEPPQPAAVAPPPPLPPPLLPTAAPAAGVAAPPVRERPASAGSPQRIAGVVLIGVGGAAIAVGAVAGALVVAQHASLAAVCGQGPCPSREQGAVDAYHAKGWVSTGGFIGGAVVAGIGTAVLLTASKRAPGTGVSVTPYVGLGVVGAAGRFR